MNKKLDHLKMLAQSDFMGACVWAEHNIPSLGDYFDTWAKYCGAPKEVFIGHAIRAIIDMDKSREEMLRQAGQL